MAMKILYHLDTTLLSFFYISLLLHSTNTKSSHWMFVIYLSGVHSEESMVSCVCVCVCAHVQSIVLTLATPWTAAHQAPLSMEFSRKEYWTGLPCPPPGDLSKPGIESASLTSPALAGWCFTSWAAGKPQFLAWRSLNSVKEKEYIQRAIFTLQQDNYKGTILETWAICYSPSVNWERFHFTEVTLSWALRNMTKGKPNQFQRNHNKENQTNKS